MMAGIETPLGQLGPITEPAAAPVSATPSADQLAQGQQRASKAYSLDPMHRPSQGQSQDNSIRLKQGQWLGNGQMAQGQASGGDPLFAATMAAPTFEVDQQISNVRKQKAKLSDWIAKQGEQFKGKAADPYQPAYEQYVGSEQGKFIKDVADTYFEGDVNKAWKGVYDDPELRAQFDRNNRYLAAIGQANKGGYDYYEKVDKSIVDGNTEVDPETRQLLEDGLNAKWAFNGQGAAHNAAQFDRLNDRLTLNKMFDDFYREGVASAGDVKEGVGEMKWSVERDPKTGRKFLVIPKEKNYDEFVDSFVQQAMKDGPYRNEDEVRRFAEARVPRESTVKVTPLALPRSSGSGGGSADKPKTVVGEVEVGLSANYPDNTPTKNPTPVYRVPIARLVDGRSELMTKKDFRDGTGASIKMIPTHLALSDLDGKLYIEGMGEAEKGTDNDSDSDSNGATVTNKVPYIGNEKTFELFVGAEQAESAKAKAYAARNSDPMRKQSRPFIEPTRQATETSEYSDADIAKALKALGSQRSVEEARANPAALARLMSSRSATTSGRTGSATPSTRAAAPAKAAPAAAKPAAGPPQPPASPAGSKVSTNVDVVAPTDSITDSSGKKRLVSDVMKEREAQMDSLRNPIPAAVRDSVATKPAEVAAPPPEKTYRTAQDLDPKGPFKGGRAIKTSDGYYIVDKNGRKFSIYFNSEDEVKDVMRKLEEGIIDERWLSSSSRSVLQAFEKLLKNK